MNKITQLEIHDREELFSEAAYKMAVHPSIVEKDYWVVWILEKIFSDEALSKILMLKAELHFQRFLMLSADFQKI